MGWGIIAITFLGVFMGFVILQEMFSQRHWRSLVNGGDRWAIRTLLEQEIERWRELRVPKGMDASLWHGIQTSEIAGVGRDFVNLICSAAGEYRVVEGRRQEVSTPLDEGMKLAAALIERVFYDVPNVRLSLVRVDVYTTFRSDDGALEQQCILSTVAERADADRLPWDDLRPNEIINRFESKFRLSDTGASLPVDPGPVMTEDLDEESALSLAAPEMPSLPHEPALTTQAQERKRGS